MNTTEGYLLVQMGPRRYFEQALNAALSVKYNDPEKQVCLVTDNVAGARTYSDFFHHIKELELLSEHHGTSYKLFAPQYTPFARTILLDTDTFIAKKDSGFWWKYLEKYTVGLVGSRPTLERAIRFLWWQLTGKSRWKCKGRQAKQWKKKVKKIAKIPYLITGYNGGSIYFDDSVLAKKIFLKALELFNKHNKDICPAANIEGRHITNEDLLLACALVFYKQAPVPIVVRIGSGIKQWMQCICGKEAKIDIKKGECVSIHENGNIESPTIAHFPGMIHKDVYLEQGNCLRKYYNVPVLNDI